MRSRHFLVLILLTACGRSDSLPTDEDGGLPDAVTGTSDGPIVVLPDFSGIPGIDIAFTPPDISIPPGDILIINPPDIGFPPPDDIKIMPFPDGGLVPDIAFNPQDFGGGPPDFGFTPDLNVGPCGGPGQACCAQNKCNDGGCCANAICVASGANCGNGQACSDGNCVACGGAGTPCCANNTCNNNGCCGLNKTCVAPGGDCGGNFGVCTNQGCMAQQVCGGDGQQCCVTPNPFPNFCSSPGTVCGGGNLPGICVPCGGPGQNCCQSNACDAGGCCVANICHASGQLCQQTMCLNGSCGGGTCGGLGQQCCGGNNGVCTAPDTRCLQGQCAACGGLNERCCNDPSSHLNIVCDAPYKPSGIMMCTCTK